MPRLVVSGAVRCAEATDTDMYRLATHASDLTFVIIFLLFWVINNR